MLARPRDVGTLGAVLAFALLAPPLHADDLGGGRAASHGRVVRLQLDRWIPGSTSAFRFIDLPALSAIQLVIVSPRATSLTIPGIGTLVADLTAPGSVVLPVAGQQTIPLPPDLVGARLFLQGIVIDPALPAPGVVLTDGFAADLFFPLAMVGNSRQTSNSLQVIDAANFVQIDRLGNSEHGYIAFSPDRRRAYVCEPGLQRNRVVVYDLTTSPITVLTTVPVSGGIRYGCAITRDGRRIYVPIHTGIAIVDGDPTSATYHQQIGSFPSLITGASGTIFTGPLHVAVTPDGRKLYIAYGESLTYPTPSHIGLVDLTNPSYPERLITVQTGGSFFGLATRPYITMSEDGEWVYTIEYGVDPSIGGGGFVQGFQNGAFFTCISTSTDTEVIAMPTYGYDQQQIAVDRMGRNVWIPQLTRTRYGEVIRIDVDHHAQNRFAITQNIAVDPTPYTIGAGPKGVGTTPDGATVIVAISDDYPSGPHQSSIIRIDALTNTIVPGSLPGESLCTIAAVQQR